MTKPSKRLAQIRKLIHLLEKIRRLKQHHLQLMEHPRNRGLSRRWNQPSRARRLPQNPQKAKVLKLPKNRQSRLQNPNLIS